MAQTLVFYVVGLLAVLLQALPPTCRYIFSRAGAVGARVSLAVSAALLGMPVLMYLYERSESEFNRDWDVALGGGAVFTLAAGVASSVILLAFGACQRGRKSHVETDGGDTFLRCLCALEAAYIIVELLGYWRGAGWAGL